MSCQTRTVKETVCIGADVVITPEVYVGEPQSYCVGPPLIGECDGFLEQYCSFSVSQRICIQIPLNFSASAVATPTGIACGTPAIGECGDVPPPPTGCAHTIGYFKNHLEETNALITAAGGFIILGSGSNGLSYTVTTANAFDVLNINTPSPPVPPTNPFAPQYRVLYAQLLGAKLNILNGASCQFAIAAIEAADEFIANSPTGGSQGAPELQEDLELFNSGSAPECPGHCEDEEANDLG